MAFEPVEALSYLREAAIHPIEAGTDITLEPIEPGILSPKLGIYGVESHLRCLVQREYRFKNLTHYRLTS